jgi:putative membrane protein
VASPHLTAPWALSFAAALIYAAGLLAARRRGRSWPAGRAACWYAGVGAASIPTGMDFVSHMAGHLLLGMVAPLLLVLGAPGTLALRALPVRAARRLSRLLAGRPVRLFAHPVTATVIAAGGLWILYTTPIYPVTMRHPFLMQTHMLLAGCLFVYAVAGMDPMPHRPSYAVRAAGLLAFLASHAILAKYLYAHPPLGVTGAEAANGAELMYYGGDVADLALVVIFCWQWYYAARFRVGARRAPQPWRIPSRANAVADQGGRPQRGQRDRDRDAGGLVEARPQDAGQPADEDDRTAHQSNSHVLPVPPAVARAGHRVARQGR